MKILHSFKYRIAITIFLLEIVLLSVVLWQTQSSAYYQAKTEIQDRDEVVTNLLAESSRRALLTLDFDQLQPFFTQAAVSSHVIAVDLTDYRNIVVVSSNADRIGQPMPLAPIPETAYLIEEVFENGSGKFGHLRVQLSSLELQEAQNNSLRFAIVIALFGMVVIAAVGVFMGFVLTKRLNKIIKKTSKFAHGKAVKRFNENGNDELSQLSESLNIMMDKVNVAMQEMRHMAFHDPLTGLANRRNYETALNKAFESAISGEHTHCLMLLDLDEFKKVNDSFGHDIGDQVLVEIAQLMTSNVRTRDVLVRMGGDEFSLLIERTTLGEMQALSEKLRSLIMSYKLQVDDKVATVGVSVGVVMIDGRIASVEQIMKLADRACYAAKKSGRNTVCFSDEVLRSVP